MELSVLGEVLANVTLKNENEASSSIENIFLNKRATSSVEWTAFCMVSYLIS
jgi:hypothetical protein